LGANSTSGNVWYWAGNVAFKDLLREGNTLGLVFGQPPKLTGETDTSYHLEGLYKIKVSDNILVTPGVLVILDPQHSQTNPNILVGTIRTTFSF
jgi:carbohydrate-selective porin OprB